MERLKSSTVALTVQFLIPSSAAPLRSDTSTSFKECHINRFLRLSFHLVTLHWYHNVLPVVIDVIERNSVSRDHMTAMSHHIESTYTVRFGIDDYNPAVWRTIFDLFERPHSLKECVSLQQVGDYLRPGSREL